MELIETFIKGKRPDQERCEDGFFFSPDFAAVIDGCTTRSGLEYGGKSPGRLAMETVKDALSKMPRDISCLDALKMLDKAIADFYETEGMLCSAEKNPALRIACYVAIYSDERHEAWCLGDCGALVGDTFYATHKKVDILHAEYRSYLIRSMLLDGASEEELLCRQGKIRKLCDSVSCLQKKFQNSDDSEYGYSVLDGFLRILPSSLVVVSVPKGESIALATDGYMEVFPSLEQTEKRHTEILAEDPLCYRIHKSVKGVEEGNCSFDDRTYLRIMT